VFPRKLRYQPGHVYAVISTLPQGAFEPLFGPRNVLNLKQSSAAKPCTFKMLFPIGPFVPRAAFKLCCSELHVHESTFRFLRSFPGSYE
jgi:hypothetical protein